MSVEPPPLQTAEQQDKTTCADQEDAERSRLEQTEGLNNNSEVPDEVPLCRICYEGTEVGPLLSACRCKGTMGYIHCRCLETWLETAGRARCELCGFAYKIQLSRRYSALSSVCVWLWHHADLRLLSVDMLTLLVLTPLVLVGMILGVSASKWYASKEDEQDTDYPSAALTSAGLMLLCGAILTAYCFWVVSVIGLHVNTWYHWWINCNRVRLIIGDTPPVHRRVRRWPAPRAVLPAAQSAHTRQVHPPEIAVASASTS